MPLSDLLAEAYAIARREHIPLAPPYPRCTLFFSVSSGKERARVVTASGDDFEQTWRDGSTHIRRESERLDAPPRWLRVDWVFTAQSETWAGLGKRLAATKRNYFRFGLALDAGFTLAVTEQELNANAMLYPGATEPAARLNPKNFARYVQQRFGSEVTPDFSSGTPVWVLSTRGVFCEAHVPARLLAGPGRNAGRRVLPPLDADSTLDLVTRASRFLARQVQPDGRFIYGHHPCFDRRIPSYNALRHASTTYSMVEAWELTREPDLQASIERALSHLVEQLIQRTDTPDGVTRAFVVDTGNEIKLGANAVAILALTKYREVSGSDDHVDLLEQLALGIEYMQDPETGAFRHVIAWPDLALRDAFRIIYYDGEAAFGLMRLYGQTRDPRWLAMVERAFEHFIASGHEDAHDHWLSYCVNELTLHRPDERLFRFGLRNVAGHLDFVIERITTFPTLLELMMAAERMLRRIDGLPEHRHLLAEIDLEKFYRALHTRANYLLNGHFWPEFAMFFARPDCIVDSFFIRHHSFRVRIDDVEHYLSGLVAYRKYLETGQPRVGRELPHGTRGATDAPPRYAGGPNWNAQRLAYATGGAWRALPDDRNWAATGVCIWAPSMEAGQIAGVAPSSGKAGLTRAALAALPFRPQALMATPDTGDLPETMPILDVEDITKATLAMGQYARSQMQGRVIAVTGSAGKTTTVNLIAHALRPWGDTAQTRHNANLPPGIAWNLASIPWDTPHVVMELAIGRMAQNTQLVRPDVAVFTNVSSAHLEFHGSRHEIARRKSRIFDGMARNGVAVICRDIEEWPIIAAAARENGLRVVSFGIHFESDVRLFDYDRATGASVAEYDRRRFRFRVGAAGRHMALNGLALLGVCIALELDPEPALATLPLFQPLPGRGAVRDLTIDGMRIRLLDEAYNANPASMVVAIELACDLQPPASNGRRLFILGDMLELGEESHSLHLGLQETLQRAAPDRLILCGEHMRALAARIEGNVPTDWYPDADALAAKALAALRDGDLVLVKSSGGTGLNRIVELMQRANAPLSAEA